MRLLLSQNSCRLLLPLCLLLLTANASMAKESHTGAKSASPQIREDSRNTTNSFKPAVMETGTESTVGNSPTVIHGISTAGQVRVNNLANLEAFLNFWVFAIQLIFVLTGRSLLAQAAKASKNGEGFVLRIAGSILCLALSSGIPGFVNFLITDDHERWYQPIQND